MLPIDLDIGNVILKDRWDVYLWRRSQCRGYEEVAVNVDVGRFLDGTAECRSSRDAEHEMIGMLTSGKVPLEKTLIKKGRRSASGMVDCVHRCKKTLTSTDRSFRKHRHRR